jgi:hypothetical protein
MVDQRGDRGVEVPRGPRKINGGRAHGALRGNQFRRDRSHQLFEF